MPWMRTRDELALSNEAERLRQISADADGDDAELERAAQRVRASQIAAGTGAGLGARVPRTVIVETLRRRKLEALTVAIQNAQDGHRRERATMEPELVTFLRDLAEQNGYPKLPDPPIAMLRAELENLPDAPPPILLGSELVPWDELHDEEGALRPQYVPDSLTRERMNLADYVALVRTTEARARAAAERSADPRAELEGGQNSPA